MVEFKVHRTIGDNRVEAFDPHAIVSILPHKTALLGEFKYITELYLRRRVLWNRRVLVLASFTEVCRKVAEAKVDIGEELRNIAEVVRENAAAAHDHRNEAADILTKARANADIVSAAKVIVMDQADQAKHQVVLAREIADEAQHAKREALEHRNDAKGFQEMACMAATSAKEDADRADASADRSDNRAAAAHEHRLATAEHLAEAAEHATNAAACTGDIREHVAEFKGIVEEVTK